MIYIIVGVVYCKVSRWLCFIQRKKLKSPKERRSHPTKFWNKTHSIYMDNNEQNNLIPQNKIKIYRFKKNNVKAPNSYNSNSSVHVSTYQVCYPAVWSPSRMLLAVITFRLKMSPFWEMGLIFVSLGY